MKLVQINEMLWVAPQIDPDDFATLKERGFTAVVNNRPDGEEPGQPTAAEAAATAASLGLAYSHLPFAGYGFDEAFVRQHQAALTAQPGPVVAHCRSGTRSLTIWAIGEVLDGRMAIDEVDAFGQSYGFDLSGVHRWFANQP
ncbi:MAG: TIGR01244 family sulfur transferase [Chelatococcus sp.]|jgi:uncharacterized protein (TIGR01244 family)|nr:MULTISPECIES: TIGR01244 family sulfur transferase [unclassified Chelatococcus]MCO5076033.1 TIGR01244 family sulfur transferase [Chelatococcus sp.]CAH1668636.1 conserved hypothetical protein [Hyphomicrobiales bacterium]CAH1679901.1 conserved hypothetical protein [Hyphomicrobiales bacterium]